MIQWAWRTCLGVLLFCVPAPAFLANAADAPVPLLEKDKPVDWWFVYKFNAQTFPTCDKGEDADRECPFGGNPAAYRNSQQFVFASQKAMGAPVRPTQ